jgi:hypothetical protein
MLSFDSVLMARLTLIQLVLGWAHKVSIVEVKDMNRN